MNGPHNSLKLIALQHIEKLVQFGLRQRLLQPLDADYTRNALLSLFNFTAPCEDSELQNITEQASIAELLEPLLDYGYELGLISDNTTTSRDLLDARIMGLLLPRPSDLVAAFERTASERGLKAATDEFYQLNIDSNYIRMDRIATNDRWLQPTEYGELEITINLSKPEKDPKEIELLRSLPSVSYPSGLLAKENVGYAGRLDHPARQNLRILPLTLRDEAWFFQYSPYVYYNEHSIIFRGEQVPMLISHASFERLLDFVDQYPHYFVGSNADLPIVGGSILNHDHFQGGRHVFPMEKAALDAEFSHADFPGVSYGIVKWPMSVLRLTAADRGELLQAAGEILDAWRAYSDEEAEVIASTSNDGELLQHNTITPIVRMRDNHIYEMDLVLRNNRTSSEHPEGIFHPHRNLHHIKKENIGLIEVMGLAVLPGRLKRELEEVAAYLSGEEVYEADLLATPTHPLHSHANWIASLIAQHGTKLSLTAALQVVRSSTGAKFAEVLEHAGIYKRTEAGELAFRRFVTSIGLTDIKRPYSQ